MGGPPMNCTKCNTELEPVFKPYGGDKDFQFKNALVVEFIGGYGMFDDSAFVRNSTASECRALLCHDCAHQFVKDNPWVKVDAKGGHAHADEVHAHD